MNRIGYWLMVCTLVWLTACKEEVVPSKTVDEKPVLFPDYVEVTIPSTIAPLNFRVEAEYEKIDVKVQGVQGDALHVQERSVAKFPVADWTALLAQNRGGELKLTISLKQEGKWIQYAPFSVYVSEAPIDYGLVYRLIAPGYEVYSKMGIYQRDLSNFTQTAIYENTLIPSSCVNCHSFCHNDPTKMSLHLRGDHGGTIFLNNGTVDFLNTKTQQTISSCVYPYWHPSGRFVAYSVNHTQQVFHAVRDERIEVIDLASDVVVYDVEQNALFSCPQLKSETAFETFPAFSPDGKSLYFCSAVRQEMPMDYQKVKYNLCRIAFDPETKTFSQQVDTLVAAASEGKSVSFPRPTPDGKYLVYTLSNYGNFSIWHREADLYMLDLQSGKSRRLDEINSPDVESYHSFSSNGRWMVFSSRRLDGLYTRPYIVFVGEDGRMGKPFLLPQEDPEQNEMSLYSYNIPEFVTAPVSLDIHAVEQKAMKRDYKNVGYE